MSIKLTKRAESLLQKYYQDKELVQPKISALEAKIRELKNGVLADGNEHREIMTELKKLTKTDQFDGNGLRVNTVPYLRLINQIESLPVTKSTPTGSMKGRDLSALEETIDGAIYEDERSLAAVNQVKAMVENKMMTMKEAQIILSLFLYEPAGSNGRGMAESRLASAQYNKGDK
jgi:hypothetical protein